MEVVGKMALREVKVQSFRDISFTVVKGIMHPEYSYFTFEGEESEFKNKYWNIQAGDVVFDIGASYGGYTLPAGIQGAYVYSFEPERSVFLDLYTNIFLNHCQGNCFAFDNGFWSCLDTIDMKDYAPHWPKECITGKYRMDTIDNFICQKNIEKLTWIKIDVEGAEEHVVQGGLQSIKKYAPKLIIECHVFLDNQLVEKIKSKLLSVCPDYKFEEISRPPCTMLYAEKR